VHQYDEFLEANPRATQQDTQIPKNKRTMTPTPTPMAVEALLEIKFSNLTKHPVELISSFEVAFPFPQPSLKTLQQVSGTSSVFWNLGVVAQSVELLTPQHWKSLCMMFQVSVTPLWPGSP